MKITISACVVSDKLSIDVKRKHWTPNAISGRSTTGTYSPHIQQMWHHMACAATLEAS